MRMPLTAQEILNKIWNGVREQGRPSINRWGVSVMRGPHGEKCGAGQAIPDEVWGDDLEGSIRGAYDKCRLSTSIVRQAYAKNIKPFLGLLEDCQFAHDSATLDTNTTEEFFTKFERAMKGVARRYKLKPLPTKQSPAKFALKA